MVTCLTPAVQLRVLWTLREKIPGEVRLPEMRLNDGLFYWEKCVKSVATAILKGLQKIQLLSFKQTGAIHSSFFFLFLFYLFFLPLFTSYLCTIFLLLLYVIFTTTLQKITLQVRSLREAMYHELMALKVVEPGCEQSSLLVLKSAHVTLSGLTTFLLSMHSHFSLICQHLV